MIMMQENNDIILAGGDALVYLTEPMHKSILQHLFGAIHLEFMYLMTDLFNMLPLYAPVRTCTYIFWMTPLRSPSCVRT